MAVSRDEAFSPGKLICWLLVALLSTASFTGLHAQSDVPGDPSSTSGDFDGLSTTAGSYDAYSGNIKRTITDVVVPGTAGTIPLQFTRIYNSRANFVPTTIGARFGDANWRHNYQWEGQITTNTNGKTVYQVGYPDGRVINFRLGRNSVVSDTFARGPSATTDRFEIGPQRDPTHHYLHLADGSQVMFSVQPDSNGVYDLLRAEKLTDPYGAATALIYGTYTTTHANVVNVLTQIVEPGGRSLNITYGTEAIPIPPRGNLAEWAVIKSVYWQDTQGTVHTDASYIYYTFGTGAPNELGQTTYYTGLQSVVYSQPQKTNPQSYVTAHYTYYASNNPGALSSAPPLLVNADDPYFSGPMHRIHYTYTPAANNGVWGIAQAEQNYSTHENVSSLTQDQPNTPTTATESRGDYTNYNRTTPVSRSFQYGEDQTGTTVTNAQVFQVRIVTDFEGNPTYTYYYPQGDTANRWGYVSKVTNLSGTSTLYDVEPYAGKVKQVTLPSGLTRSTLWAGMDGNVTNPYYVFQTTDERHHTTYYSRNSNTGLVRQIDYPDNSHEFFTYYPFSGPNGSYYKIWTYTNKLGAQFTFNYGQNDDGQGPADLLKSVTRVYTDAITGASHSETIFYSYDPTNRVKTVQDQRGITEQFSYNPRGQVTQVLHVSETNTPSPSHVDYIYDDDGTCTKVYDELTHGTTITYDDYRRVTAIKVPVNAPPENSSQPILTRTRCFAYDRRDNANRPIGTALSHTGTNWSVSWLPTGAGVQRIFSRNNWLSNEYDGMSIEDSQNPVLPTAGTDTTHNSIVHNVLGQPLSTTDAQNFTTSYTYDSYNRPFTVSDLMGSSGHVTTYNYAASGAFAGLASSVTTPGPDANIFPTSTSQFSDYDNLGRLKLFVYPPNNGGSGHNSFDSTYDAAGNLASQDDGAQTSSNSHLTGYHNDGLGRKSKMTYADGTTEAWTYDASGNVATYTNRAGAVCTYQYNDGRNRCTYCSWSVGGTVPVTYEYDVVGHLTHVQNFYSDLHFTYDDSGAVRTEQALRYGQSNTFVTTYTHDADGNVDSILYPRGDKSSFIYDSQERCIQVVLNDATLVCQHTYMPNGNWLHVRYLPYCGLETVYDYQSNGRVKDLWHINYATSTTLDLRYFGYAPNGQLSYCARANDSAGISGLNPSGSSLENGSGDAYYYYPDGSLDTAFQNYSDPSGWPNAYSLTADSSVDKNTLLLAGGSAPSYKDVASYDAAGNRTAATLKNQPITYADNATHPGMNRYDSCSYDPNGNTSTDGLNWTYYYNANNQLTSAYGPGGQVMLFDYDGLGRLSAENVNGVGTTFFYAGSQRIEERDNSGTPIYQYFFDAPGSDEIFFRFNVSDGGSQLWYLYDQFGNTTHVTDGGGNVVEQYLYDASGLPSVYDKLGNVRAASAYNNRYLFRGASAYRWDSPAGLYYARARFYQPQQGRWLQPDPIGQAGGLNIYGYCHNDPVNSFDASGLSEEDGDDGGSSGSVSFVSGGQLSYFTPGDLQAGGVLSLGDISGISIITPGYYIVGGYTHTPSGNDLSPFKQANGKPGWLLGNLPFLGGVAWAAYHSGNYGEGDQMGYSLAGAAFDLITFGFTSGIGGVAERSFVEGGIAVTEGIATPYGVAFQSDLLAAQIARTEVSNGATLYRVGTAGRSAAGEAQFWSLEHPLSPGFAERYGIPAENVEAADFIETGTLKPGSQFVTRPAPGVGKNGGGAIEVVIPSNAVRLDSFNYSLRIFVN